MSRSLILIFIVFVCCWCINPVSAFDDLTYNKYSIIDATNTYSITQVSDYTWKSVHYSLAKQHDPDVKTLKSFLKGQGWTEKFHHENTEVTKNDLTNINNNADVHIHFGHGFNFPVLGTQMELSDHFIPIGFSNTVVTPPDVKNKWNHKWVILYSCDLFEDHAWFCGLMEGRGRGVLGFGTTTYAHYNYMITYFKKAQRLTIADAWGETNRNLNGNPKIKEEIIARTIFQNKDMKEKDAFLTSNMRFQSPPTEKCTNKPYGYEYSSKDTGNGREFIPTVNCGCNK